MKSTEFANNTKSLVDVAMGRRPADMVVRDGRWVCVQSGEIIPNTDIAVLNGRIAYVGECAEHTIREDTVQIDAAGKYLVPGLLDGHVHVESGMLTVTEFVRAVIPHGTTGLFIDPHEIANVFGLKGIRLMVDEAAVQPIHVWVQMPSCVPSAPGLETPGASIDAQDVREAMQWEGIIGLGEMMNFPGVIYSDDQMHTEMAETRLAKKVIGGHYASPDLERSFHGYVAGGAQDDHEGTRREDAVARVRQGMKVMMRYGSGWHDVAAQIKAVTEMGLDPRHFILCTDDSHSETLVNEGHMNRAVIRAIRQGIPPMTAIQMATLNTAEHFNVADSVGLIAPGRFADILLVGDLAEFDIDMVVAKGQVVVQEKRRVWNIPEYSYPDWMTNSVNINNRLEDTDFRLDASDIDQEEVTANVIGVVENQAPTKHLRLKVPVTEGIVGVEIERDIAKIAVVERHHATGDIEVGLVNGFGFDVPCAVASTVAHDCHQMVIIGTSESDMALAGNELVKAGGGQLVVRDGEVVGQVDLPIAGLMSNQRAEVVAQQASSVLDGFRDCGCKLNNPNMQLSLIALVVIPELRISDKGLVDVNKFDFIPVIES